MLRPGAQDDQGRWSLADVFADYHPQDRVAVVSPVWEEAFVENAVALTALTALFYDAQRKSGRPFFDYPSHYLLLCRHAESIQTRRGLQALSVEEAGRPWGQVDLWPETQWLGVAPDAASLLRAIFALHTHRLFWPEHYPVVAPEQPLPAYMRRILASRLKAVYLYNSTMANWEIGASPGAQELLAPTPGLFAADFPPPVRNAHRVVDSETFLTMVDACFAKEPVPAG